MLTHFPSKHLLAGLMAAAICLAAPMAAQAAHPKEAQIDAAVKKLMEENHVPGAAISVMHKGEILIAKGYGYANLEHMVPVKPETVFQSASVGKMFTSSVVLLLEKDGKLSLDDKILKHVPNGPKTWANITVQNLMMHRSGIPDYEESFGTAALRKDYSDDEFIAYLHDKPLDFTPGTQFKYSNAAYVVLGIVIKNASGEFYGDILAERVFGPSGMKTAQVNDIDQIIPNRSQGYIIRDEKMLRDYYVSPTLSRTADGSLLFSVQDMAAWDKELFYGTKALPLSFTEEMTKVRPFSNGKAQENAYGYGWGITTIADHKAYAHSGGWQGFNTFYLHIPEKELSIVVLLNLEGGGATKMSKSILEILESD